MTRARRAVWRVTVAGVLAAPAVTHAQQPGAGGALVTATITPDTVQVGERFTLRVRVRAPKVASVAFPDVPAPTGRVAPVDPRVVEDGPPGDVLDRTATYTFVAWEPGGVTPELGPVVVSVAGQQKSFAVNAAGVVVRTVLPDTTEQAAREIRSPVPTPGRFAQWIVVGVVGLVLATWLWLRRRRRMRDEVEGPTVDAWRDASAAFEAVDALGLLEAGEPGRHVIAYVDVLRAYLARRFPVLDPSLDAPSVARALRDMDFPAAPHALNALLARDTEIRFAHAPLDADEAATLVTAARTIARDVQDAHEARLRAMERPPRPRRR
jgi:hypothetical protein